MNCRICNTFMEEFEMLHGCRAEHLGLFTGPHTICTDDYMIYHCPNCSHFQIDYRLPENYYDGYTSSGAGQQQYIGTLNQAKEKIDKLSKYSTNHDSIVEIGCGNPSGGVTPYKFACQAYKKYLGVEPSMAEYEDATKGGIPVVHGYFNQDLRLTEKFSSFMTFQVFEHLTDLYPVLNYAFEILKPGGTGLINVPNGQRIIKENLYHQVTAEHVNYFTPYSMAVMAHKCGFDIIEIDDVSETLELDLYVKKPDFRKTLDQTKKDQKQKLQNYLQDSSCITIWGAGGKAPIYSTLLNPNNPVKHIFDSGSEKIGKYIGNIPIPVEAVSEEVLNDSDVVLIFASSYNREIISQLQQKLHYTGKIICFEDQTIKCLE